MALICQLVWLKKNTPNQKYKQPLKQGNSNKKGLNTAFVAFFDPVLHENAQKIKERVFSSWMNLSMALSVIILNGKGVAKIPNHLKHNHLIAWCLLVFVPVLCYMILSYSKGRKIIKHWLYKYLAASYLKQNPQRTRKTELFK